MSDDEVQADGTTDGERAAAPPARPLSPPPPALVPAARSRSGRRPVLIALAVLVVGAIAAAVVVVRSGAPEPGADEPGADEPLDRAGAAIDPADSADSFRMHQVSVDVDRSSLDDGVGTELRTVTDTEVSGGDWHITVNRDGEADEEVMIGGRLYGRFATDDQELADLPFLELPADLFPHGLETEDDAFGEDTDMAGLDGDGDGEIDDDVGGTDVVESMLVSALDRYYLYDSEPVGGDGAPVALPTGFVDRFGSFEDAEVTSDDGDTLVLTATRQPPADLDRAVEVDLPVGVFELTVGAGGLPTKLTLTVDGRTSARREEITFTDWGADITIGVPEDDVDRTPWVDEDAVAAARANLTPLAPTVVRDGLVLSFIDGFPRDDSGERPSAYGCEHLQLHYDLPIEDGAEAADEPYPESTDFLNIYLTSADCSIGSDPTPFVPGEFGDVPSRRHDDDPGSVEVLVGDTVVRFWTTYVDDLPAMVGSLAPFDLDAELARVQETMETLSGP
jgi:hypothetical protein